MRRLCSAALAALVLAGCHHFDQEKMAGTLRETVTAKAAPRYAEGRWKTMQAIYKERDYEPIWLDRDRPRDRTRQLVDVLTHADEQGLRMRDYDLPGLSTALHQAYREKGHGMEELALLDLRLTSLFLDYGTDLLTGRLDPATVDTGWYIRQRQSVADSVVRQAIRQDDFAAMVAPLTPQQKDYGALVKALGHYRDLAQAGGWAAIPAGPALKPGAAGPRVAALRARLAATGDLDGADGDRYDARLQSAVREYQARNGIDTTGVADTETLAALNVPVTDRVRQIELNLERLRWLPTDFGPRYTMVNIPDYTLRAYDGGKEALSMRVVVGQEYGHATPVFADTMNHVVFGPYWNVPRSILDAEIVPKMREDPGYLAAHHYEVVRGDAGERVDPRSINWKDLDTTDIDFRVRQAPGPDNALGRVKFMFPNQFAIYLHDTPARSLFSRDQRALSHGCVRLEHPDQFAAYVFEGQPGWDDKRIHEAMATDSSVEVTVKRPVPVYIVYLTAFMRDGRLNFRNDLYGTDRRALARLGTPQPQEVLDSARTALRKFFKS